MQLYCDVISLLPNELSLRILSYLRAKNLIICAKVSRQWQELSLHDDLWEDICVRKNIGQFGSFCFHKGQPAKIVFIGPPLPCVRVKRFFFCVLTVISIISDRTIYWPVVIMFRPTCRSLVDQISDHTKWIWLDFFNPNHLLLFVFSVCEDLITDHLEPTTVDFSS